jgi:hypothetical protein
MNFSNRTLLIESRLDRCKLRVVSMQQFSTLLQLHALNTSSTTGSCSCDSLDDGWHEVEVAEQLEEDVFVHVLLLEACVVSRDLLV